MKKPFKSIAVAIGLVLAGRVSAQTFTTLLSFNYGADGTAPNGELVSSGGVLYGTANTGGDPGYGTVFKVNTNGTGFTTLYSFTNGIDGAGPRAGLVLSGNTLYGTAYGGGAGGNGTVFRVNTDGSGFAVLHGFSVSPPGSYDHVVTNADGAYPSAALILSGGILYGTTQGGGSSADGAVFAVHTDGTGFTTLHSFNYTDGLYPNGLVLSGNTLYGAASDGGAFASGTIFALNIDSTGFTVLHSFSADSNGQNSDGANPVAGLNLSGGALYGTAYGGGSSRYGTVFAVNTDGSGFATLHSFAAPASGGPVGSEGFYPDSRLVQSGGTLYGTTAQGGGWGNGTIFAVNTNGSGFVTLNSFAAPGDGSVPLGGLLVAGATLYGTASDGGASGVGSVFALNTDGTGLTALHSFTGADGLQPSAPLFLSNNVLYGTANGQGGSSNGTVFAVNTDGTGSAILHVFAGADDSLPPFSGLTLAGSTLYGQSQYGGAFGNGTVFKVGADGSGFTNLYSFAPLDLPSAAGPLPLAHSQAPKSYTGLLLSGNTLYGTEYQGGAPCLGSVFAINADGTGFTNLFVFVPAGGSSGDDPNLVVNSNGAGPNGLVLSGDTLYGTARFGGASGVGTVFSVSTKGGAFAALHTFTTTSSHDGFGGSNIDGALPGGGLVLSGNVLYGTAQFGGASGNGTVFAVNTDGSGFAVLHNFAGAADGANPCGGLFLAGDTLYGTASGGGAYTNGTVFSVNIDGSGFSAVHAFTGGLDGAVPYAGLVSAGSSLYGTASEGGSAGLGTVFRVSFPPQLSAAPSAGSLMFTWPTNYAGFDYTGFTLQSTTNLSSAGWIGVPATPVVIGGLNSATVPLSGPLQFYRLTGH